MGVDYQNPTKVSITKEMVGVVSHSLSKTRSYSRLRF